MENHHKKVNSMVAFQLWKQGFSVFACGYDAEPICVEARRNNIQVAVLDGEILFQEFVFDEASRSFCQRELDFVFHWTEISDLNLGFGLIPNEIESYIPRLVCGLDVGADVSALLEDATERSSATIGGCSLEQMVLLGKD